MEYLMQAIQIIAPPPGQAPEWVRKQWVGCILPTSGTSLGRHLGVLDHKPNDDNAYGYRVEKKVAIEVLRQKSPEAAEWWDENTVIAPGSGLVFDQKVCMLVMDS